MSAGAELYETERWLRDTLAAGTALCALIGGTASPRFHSDFVPQGSVIPAIILEVSQGEDVGAVTGTANATNIRARVRAVVQDQSYQGAAAIMKQADPLLMGKRGTVLDGTVPALYVLSCIRTGPIRYPEVVEGKHHRHLGSEYSIWVENA